jgi:hypothetical protein
MRLLILLAVSMKISARNLKIAEVNMRTACETNRNGATRLLVPISEYSFETYPVGVKRGFRCLEDATSPPADPRRWRGGESIQHLLHPLLVFLKTLGSTVAAAKALAQSRCNWPVRPVLAVEVAARSSTAIATDWKSDVSENS